MTRSNRGATGPGDFAAARTTGVETPLDVLARQKAQLLEAGIT